jgi:hypothetical protein
MIGEIGLGLLVVGLLIQAAGVWKGSKELSRGFLAVYMLGCVLLSYDGFVSGAPVVGALNLGCVAAAGLSLIKLR